MQKNILVKRMIAGYIALVIIPTISLYIWFMNVNYQTYTQARRRDINAWAEAGSISVENTLKILAENGQFVQNNASVLNYLQNGPFDTVNQLQLWFSDLESVYHYLRYSNSYVDSTALYTPNQQILNLGGFFHSTKTAINDTMVTDGRSEWIVAKDGKSLIYRQNIYERGTLLRLATFEARCSTRLLADGIADTMTEKIYFCSDDVQLLLTNKTISPCEPTQELVELADIPTLRLRICVEADEYGKLGSWNLYTPLLILVVCSLICTIIYIGIVYRLSNRIRSFSKHIAYSTILTPFEDTGNDELHDLIMEYNGLLRTNHEMLEQVEISELRQHEAHYLALQAQINPHFIHNTLEAARMAIEIGQTELTSEILCALGQQLRYALSEDTAEVTLGEEVKNVRQYLYIQKLRMDERLNYDIQMAEGTGDILCPRFLLQPLVENAIVHGIDPLENGGHLTINAHMTGAIIEICIHDNGLGMSPEALRDLEDRLSSGASVHRDSAKFNGLGMNNVIQRMKYLYGGSFDSKLISDEGNGFTVILSWKGTTRNEASDRR